MNNGGAAFPVQDMRGDEPGMTLRDYFAGQALMGHIVGFLSAMGEMPQSNEAIAAHCYKYADAMLAEREKEKV